MVEDSQDRCYGCGSIIPAGFTACTCTDDIELDIEHIRLKDGRCVISFNGQGHLPCSEHPRVCTHPRSVAVRVVGEFGFWKCQDCGHKGGMERLDD